MRRLGSVLNDLDRLSKMSEAICTAIGEASMCWDPEPTGVFDAERATDAGERLFDEIVRTDGEFIERLKEVKEWPDNADAHFTAHIILSLIQRAESVGMPTDQLETMFDSLKPR